MRLWEEYEKGLAEYEQGVEKLNTQLEAAQQKLDDGENELIISQATLNSSQLYAQQEVTSGETQINTLENLLEEAKQKQNRSEKPAAGTNRFGECTVGFFAGSAR